MIRGGDFLSPPAGPRAQGWTGKCKSGHCHRLAEVGIHPLAIGQDRPSRLGPAGEGRSDSRVLHLPPRGQARYPEGGRRREDEPPRQGWRVRANAGRRRARRQQSEVWVTPNRCRPRDEEAESVVAGHNRVRREPILADTL
jgi:hypothetical protein